jgi:hypothetical protein
VLSYAAVPTALRARWPLAAALLITAFGALLRLDAFTQKFGTLERPAWARAVTHAAPPLAARVRPDGFVWRPEPRPYVGGDPITYLLYAREMTTFYQPHVREPVFLAVTRLALWATGGQDAGISFASMAGSLLAVFATYLLGAALVSRAWGLGGALLMAIGYENVTWAVDGWRDDLFTATLVLAAWALVRFRDRPTFANALLVGFTGGAACLTRITALSFVLPALAWIAAGDIGRRTRGLDGGRGLRGILGLERSRGLRGTRGLEGTGGVRGMRGTEEVRAVRETSPYTVTALVVLAALVVPYLVSCGIASGDPFLALNYHTSYYRFAEGLPIDAPMSAAGYIAAKAARHPIETIDVGVTGLFVRPFQIKWAGLEPWAPGLGTFAGCASLAGLVIWLFSPRGRFMLVILLTSLVPFAFTWNIGGGGEWRFTMHAYPLYVVAAVYACASVSSTGWWTSRRLVARRGVTVAALGAAVAAVYVSLPWFVAREAIARREAATIAAGGRDVAFFRGGWTPPRVEGAITTRVSLGPHARMHFPLPARRDYEFSLRLDPVSPERQQRITVLFNRQLIGSLRLTWDPSRVGAYRISIPGWRTRTGENELTIVPDTMVPAGTAGDRFAWLDPARPIGIRFWYLRVLE